MIIIVNLITLFVSLFYNNNPMAVRTTRFNTNNNSIQQKWETMIRILMNNNIITDEFEVNAGKLIAMDDDSKKINKSTILDVFRRLMENSVDDNTRH